MDSPAFKECACMATIEMIVLKSGAVRWTVPLDRRRSATVAKRFKRESATAGMGRCQKILTATRRYPYRRMGRWPMARRSGSITLSIP
jgi:hypothetical protein